MFSSSSEFSIGTIRRKHDACNRWSPERSSPFRKSVDFTTDMMDLTTGSTSKELILEIDKASGSLPE